MGDRRALKESEMRLSDPRLGSSFYSLRASFVSLRGVTNMSTPNTDNAAAPAPSDFIRDIVAQHVAEKKYPRIHTRFPPEPNGYLHIGHAKSICLNFGIAREFGGICNLRMDDTNPTAEDTEYVESIQADVNWLIDGWAEDRIGLKPSPVEPFYASDYFDHLYYYAL